MTDARIEQPLDDAPAPEPEERRTGLTESLDTLDEPPSRRRRPWLAVIPVIVFGVILSLVRLPYFVLSPGPTRDVLPLIRVEGRTTYPPSGHLLLTSVYQSADRVNAYAAIEAWLDPTKAVIPERDLLAPGETPAQEVTRALSDMDTSKIDAAIVALTRYAGYPRNHGKGVLVESVFADTPAEGKLYPGDVIMEVDGVPVRDPDHLGRLIRAAGAGTALTLTVTAGGETHDVVVAPTRIRGIAYPVIGITSVATFPFDIDIESGEIGGPSAGLMWTLGLVDLLTPGDLAGGRVIAGTGTILPDGRVGPIGGIQEKVAAAERDGATVFFAPASEAADARAVARTLRVIPVKTYLDAVRYLEGS